MNATVTPTRTNYLVMVWADMILRSATIQNMMNSRLLGFDEKMIACLLDESEPSDKCKKKYGPEFCEILREHLLESVQHVEEGTDFGTFLTEEQRSYVDEPEMAWHMAEDAQNLGRGATINIQHDIAGMMIELMIVSNFQAAHFHAGLNPGVFKGPASTIYEIALVSMDWNKKYPTLVDDNEKWVEKVMEYVENIGRRPENGVFRRVLEQKVFGNLDWLLNYCRIVGSEWIQDRKVFERAATNFRQAVEYAFFVERGPWPDSGVGRIAEHTILKGYGRDDGNHDMRAEYLRLYDEDKRWAVLKGAGVSDRMIKLGDSICYAPIKKFPGRDHTWRY